MYCSFDELPDNSRIWVFISKDEFSSPIIEKLKFDLIEFLNNWKAHNRDLISGFKIVDSHFLLIGVDQSRENPSGCSIDDLFHFIRNLELKYSLTLTDNSLIAYRENSKIHFINLSEMKQKIKQKHLSLNLSIFNSMISSKGAIKREWEIPIKHSWLKKHILTH